MDELLKLAKEVYANNVAKGFWETRNFAEKIALIHAELSEMLEETREITPRMSAKIPEFTAEQEEWADVLLRLVDLAEGRGFTEAALGAVLAKHAYNQTRPVKHGKLF